VEERRLDVRTFAAFAVALAFTAVIASPARAIVVNPNAIERPDGKGDQVIFYYDARTAFTTFVNLHNDGGSDLDVTVLFYGRTFSSPFTLTFSLDAGASRIIDVGALKTAEPGLPEDLGVAIATAVDNHGKAVVTRALTGNFTVANLQVHSAWGAPGAARSAINAPEPPALSDGAAEPALGTVIDGTTVLLPPIQPTNAHLAVYYDPATLEPAGLGGNQLIFVNFEDVPGEVYSAQVAVTTWFVDVSRGNGDFIGPLDGFVASGVTVTDLVSIAGSGVNGSSGSMSFNALPSAAAVNRLVFFTETLGTFATGYLLPPTVPSLL
jgi:hypothetical protein